MVIKPYEEKTIDIVFIFDTESYSVSYLQTQAISTVNFLN